MRRGIGTACLALSLISCGGGSRTSSGDLFEEFTAEYLDHFWRGHPEQATTDGVHQYDDRLSPSGSSDFAAEAADLRAFLIKLESIPESGLSPDQRVDRLWLTADIDVRLARLERERDWTRDPTKYIPFDGLNDLIKEDFAPAPERAANLLRRLDQVPRMLADARRNLRRPPRLFTETAIRTARAMAPFYSETVRDFAKSVPALEADLNRAADKAAAAVADYALYLEKELLPNSDGDLAIGRQLYDFYLKRLHLLDDDADSLLGKAQTYFQAARTELEEAAREIDPNRTWQEITEEIRDHHPTREGLLQAYCDEIHRSREHVRSHDLVTLPTGEEVRCLYTPPSQRAFSPFGDFRTPAPFSREKIGYLVLHPIEAGLPPDQEERLLRAHDYSWIQVIAPHESYPGHHLQALRAQENPRLFRKVHQSPLFSEGWGLYCEELMYETGFFKNPKATRLTQLRLRLWRAARVILDANLHTGKMSYDEARKFLVDQVRFEESSTAGEVNIYAFRPTYAISYIVGFHEILKLRDEYRGRAGERFSLKEFHDRLLTRGSMPFRLIRQLESQDR